MPDQPQSKEEMKRELINLRYWLALSRDWPELQQFQPGILRRIRQIKELLNENPS
jgi:hypothetical protein